jgi:hypothetical protein
MVPRGRRAAAGANAGVCTFDLDVMSATVTDNESGNFRPKCDTVAVGTR